MRHRLAGNKLGRHMSWRKATVRDLAKATLMHERITTTLAKAKEARKLVDRLITLGKKGTLADRRRAYAVLCDHRLVSRLFNTIAPRFKDRPGGYTRIIRLGYRRGDQARLSLLELTEKEKIIVSSPKDEAAQKIDAPVVEPKTTTETAGDTGPTKEAAPSGGLGGGLKKIFRRRKKETSDTPQTSADES